MPRPRIPGKDKPQASPAIALRLPLELMAALDKAAEQVAKERPDMIVDRTKAIRVLLAEAIAARKIQIR